MACTGTGEQVSYKVRSLPAAPTSKFTGADYTESSSSSSSSSSSQGGDDANVDWPSTALTTAVVANERDVDKQPQFHYQGYYFVPDIKKNSTAEANGNVSWIDVLQHPTQPLNYITPTPWPHFVFDASFPSARVDFTLNSESQSLLQFHSALSPSSPDFDMHVSESALASIMHTSQNILPISVRLESVHTSLPIHLSVCLKTDRVGGGSGGGSDKRSVSWNNRCMGANGVVSAEHHNNLLVSPNATTVGSKDDDGLMHRVDDLLLNNPEFNRWITANFDSLRTQLKETLHVVTHTNGLRVLHVVVPADSSLDNAWGHDMFLFIAANYRKDLARRMRLKSDPAYHHQDFNQVLVGDDGVPKVIIPVVILQEFLDDKAKKYDKGNWLMSLANMRLSVTPVNRERGWQDLKTLAQHGADTEAGHKNVALLRFSVRIVYSPYLTSRDLVSGRGRA